MRGNQPGEVPVGANAAAAGFKVTAGAGPAGESRWRLFIAVPVVGPVAGALQAWMAGGRRQRPGLKWVRPGDLHITLRFLGERPVATIPALVAAGARVARASAPLDLEVRGVGGFPAADRARTVWAGVDRGAAGLAALAAGLETELLAVVPGLDPASLPFRAHITLARVRGGWIDLNGWPHAAAVRQRLWGRLPVTAMVLFRSELRPGGPVYTALHSWPLGKGVEDSLDEPVTRR